jgi:hypothetical protein
MVSFPSAPDVYVFSSNSTVAPASGAPLARIVTVNSSPNAGAELGPRMITSQILITVIDFSTVT